VQIRVQCVVVDAHDCPRLAGFWAEALGWRVTYRDVRESVIEPPEGSPAVDVAPDIVFVQVPEGKTTKNRLHLDLRPGDQVAEVERLLGIGARHATVGQTGNESWVVLADPEGNEFCVLAPLPAATAEGASV
jgi:hypothetical protein